jgi:hypothetical protein
MIEKKRHKVTPAGRLKLKEVGAKNLREWQDRTGGAAAVSRRMNEEAVKRADELIQCAIEELGGAAKLNAKQRHLLESQKVALLVLCLTQSQFRRKGLLLQRSRPDPLLATSVSFANVIRLNLEALGLLDDQSAPAFEDASPEERRALSRKYVESRFGEARSTEQ